MNFYRPWIVLSLYCFEWTNEVDNIIKMYYIVYNIEKTIHVLLFQNTKNVLFETITVRCNLQKFELLFKYI